MTPGREVWQRITSAPKFLLQRICMLGRKARYARALETDLRRVHEGNSRLRDENRALLNSILGIAGIPPVAVTPQSAGALEMSSSAETPRSNPSSQPGPEAPATGPVSPASDATAQARSARRAHHKNLAQVAAPVRRRSWQQITRTLEFEAARKRPPEV